MANRKKTAAGSPAAKNQGRQAGFPDLFRKVRRRLFHLCLLLIAGSMAITIAFRWVPVPCSSLMIQKRIAAFWQGDKDFRFRYRWVDLKKISPYAHLAVIASEDQKFLNHMGFDFDAIEKAWEHNQRKRKVHGASTISQQLAKNLFLWPQRSFVRKGLEVYFTLLLEGLWPKHRILEVYLNVAEFGPGIFGGEAASQTYFRKPAARLTSGEAALLAATLPSPQRFNPAKPSDYLRQRAGQIQQQMRQLGGPASLRKPLGQAPSK